jgi:hypothetical protein
MMVRCKLIFIVVPKVASIFSENRVFEIPVYQPGWANLSMSMTHKYDRMGNGLVQNQSETNVKWSSAH